MIDIKFYNMLGLARRAGKIGWGHDAAMDAIKKRKAHLCVMTCDASERLKNEFQRACIYDERDVKITVLDKTMEDMRKIIGVKAAVLTVNDEGFANNLKQYL